MPPTALSPSLQSRLRIVEPIRNRSLIIVSQGKVSTGKSAWSLTAPKPLIYMKMDRELRGEFVEGLLATPGVYQPKERLFLEDPKKFTQAEAVKAWGAFTGVWRDAMQDKALRTIVLDTASYAWILIRMMEFGKLSSVWMKEYERVNAPFESLFYMAEDYGKIIVAIHRVSEEYAKDPKTGVDGRTGRWERKGYSRIDSVATVVQEHYRDGEGQFGVRILRNKVMPTLDGLELVGDEWGFPCLALQTFPGSEYEEWA